MKSRTRSNIQLILTVVTAAVAIYILLVVLPDLV